MMERDFLYWLQGYLEMSGAKTLDEKQLQIIKDHIALVAVKVTPNYITTPSLTWPAPIDTTVIC